MSEFWAGRSVLITGHTGFKGGWMTLWLHHLKAKVHGYALDPGTHPNLFEVLRLGQLLLSDTRADIRDVGALRETFQRERPEVVFHLAAQPLVRESYREPLTTFDTNVMGTANLLEAVREAASVRAVVVVTTDKVYENHEWLYPYREVDGLGGHDPYSASKAAAELVTACYRASFLGEQQVCVATARAGNVIGGGDWSRDRLIPDCIRSFQEGRAVRLRCPQSVRPWQHVLEPLAGYLVLAERLAGVHGTSYAGAWNFGPNFRDHCTVGEMARQLVLLWGETAAVELERHEEHLPHEAGMLRLDISKAVSQLGWRPRWALGQALQSVVDWQRAYMQGKDMRKMTLSQIEEYSC